MIFCNVEKREAELSVDEYLRDGVDAARFLELCKACPNYDRRWTCPPLAFDPLAFWREFKTFRAISWSINARSDMTSDDALVELRELKAQMLDELLDVERATEGSLALSAGTCELCAECAKVRGEPCIMPEKMRSSVEALGGDVSLLAERYLGIKLEWFSATSRPKRLSLIGGVLYR